MTEPAQPREDLSAVEQQQFAEVVEQFETAWHAGRHPAIEEFLTPGSDRRAVLVELIHIDLEWRLKAGEPARVENYLDRYTELSDDAPAVLDLIAAEYELRRRSDAAVTPDEYHQRFPRYAEQLRTRLTRPEATPHALATGAETTAPQGEGPGWPRGTSPPSPGAGVRYRPVRFHARGGLGEVHLAEDAELHRQVALKRIQERFAADANSRRRFLREAEITARLEHPGIVPVYGLVQGADGEPYYAMRFIEGEPLKEAIQRFHEDTQKPGGDPGVRRLALRDLLTRFVTVCRTIAFAHSRRVVHRDLKPANIMLGKYGETLVVDWGLAKELGPDGEAAPEDTPGLATDPAGPETRTGALVGTPAFMAPEQAGGKSRERPSSTAGDIYSLGATLYVLLTGRAPFGDRDPYQVLEQVQRGEFRKPRQVKPETPPALEAVCLKAMARTPADRYATALDLAADLERWLADEPVAAYPEALPARLARWARRHKPLVSGGVALLLTAVAALAIGLMLLGEKQRETDRQRRQAEANETKALRAERTAAEQAALAKEQRGLSLDTLKTVLLASQDTLKAREDRLELLDKAGIRQLREELLAKALDGLHKVARKGQRSAEADFQAVRAHLDMGDMFLLTGKTEPARQHYERAVQIAQGLQQADLRNPMAHRALWSAFDSLGDVHLKRGRTQAAGDAYRGGWRIAQAWVRTHPGDRWARRELSVSYNKIGDVALRRDQTRAAEDAYTKALAIRKELARDHPKDLLARRDLSASYSYLGDLYQARGDRPEAAHQAYREALRIDLELAAVQPHDAEAQRNLAVAYDHLGDVLPLLGREEDSLRAYQEALANWERLAQSDPHSTRAQRDVATGCTHVGNAALSQGQARVARKVYARCLEICKRLVQADPHNQEARRDLAVAWNSVGDVSRLLGRSKAALAAYREALQITKALAAADPANNQAKTDLAVCYSNVGGASLLRGQPRAALEAFRKERKINQALAERNRDNAEARRALASAQEDVGDASLELGQTAAARDAYTEALRLRKTLDSHNRQYQRELSIIYAKLSEVSVKMRREKAAWEACQKCVFIREELARTDPDNAQAASDLLEAYQRLGFIGLEFNRPAEVRAAAQKALDRAARLYKYAKVQPDHLANMAGAYALAMLAVAPGKLLDQLTPKEKAAQEEYAGRAIQVLREAILKGYRNIDQVKKDPSLDALRKREDFQKLLAEWRKELEKEGK
jgi:serine/threonine protein kinase/tetratricopeptide (TPR) repeat protein